MLECNKREIFRLVRQIAGRRRQGEKTKKVESIQDIARDYNFRVALSSRVMVRAMLQPGKCYPVLYARIKRIKLFP